MYRIDRKTETVSEIQSYLREVSYALNFTPHVVINGVYGDIFVTIDKAIDADNVKVIEAVLNAFENYFEAAVEAIRYAQGEVAAIDVVGIINNFEIPEVELAAIVGEENVTYAYSCVFYLFLFFSCLRLFIGFTASLFFFGPLSALFFYLLFLFLNFFFKYRCIKLVGEASATHCFFRFTFYFCRVISASQTNSLPVGNISSALIAVCHCILQSVF